MGDWDDDYLYEYQDDPNNYNDDDDDTDTSDDAETNHFQSGTYEFTKIILNWPYAKINTPHALKRLPSRFTNSSNLTDSYYESFKPSILEEARALLAQGIKAAYAGKLEDFSFIIQHITRARNAKNPTSIQAKGRLPKETEGRSCMALLISFGKTNVIALGTEEGIDTGKLRIKFITNSYITNDKKFAVKQKINAWVLCSFVNLQRMYEVCTIKPQVNFLHSIITGNLHTQNNANAYDNSLNSLNSFQRAAAQKFIDAQAGVYLLQGPPGTGKTTTIAQILKVLADNEERVMFCAPSNKAVAVIASRLYEKYPDISMALTGVENKLSENLRDIFIHGWNDFMANKISQFKRDVLHALKLERLVNLNLKNPEFIKKSSLAALAKLPDRLHLPNITNNISLRAPECYKEIYESIMSFIREFKNLITFIQASIQAMNGELITQLTKYSESQKITDKEKNNNHPPKPAFIDGTEKFIFNLEYYLDDIIETLKSADLELEMLNTANVVFCTLSVAGRSMMREIDEVDALIVDEASQSLEVGTTIPFVHNPEKLLLVGDIQQLPATVISPIAEASKFGRSLMDRLINYCKQSYMMLHIQYRMHPEIRIWPSNQYYQGLLKDGANITTRQLPYKTQNNFLFNPYTFINIAGHEEKNSYSFSNRKEALAIIDILKYFKSQCQMPIQKHIGIITFYAGQVDLLKRLVKGNGLGDIKVHTVDGFQGDENDIIIISFVRANNNARSDKRSNIGFLKDFRRLNVAITRAKHGLILIGHLSTLQNAHGSDVAKLITDATQRGICHNEQSLNGLVKPPKPPKANPPKQIAVTNSTQPAAKKTGGPTPSKRGHHGKFFRPKPVTTEAVDTTTTSEPLSTSTPRNN